MCHYKKIPIQKCVGIFLSTIQSFSYLCCAIIFNSISHTMLSILIPTYNFDCTELVKELQRQITVNNIEAEVVVMDDASPRHETRSANSIINELPSCRFIQLEKNVGIAKIRNLLADEAKYDKLLFLDSDVFPVNDNFVTSYLEASSQSDVVCGGLMFRSTPPSPQCTLRYK